MNTFRKMAEYEINTQKSVAFLHADDKHTKKKIGKTILFEIAKQNEKLQINSPTFSPRK